MKILTTLWKSAAIFTASLSAVLVSVHQSYGVSSNCIIDFGGQVQVDGQWTTVQVVRLQATTDSTNAGSLVLDAVLQPGTYTFSSLAAANSQPTFVGTSGETNGARAVMSYNITLAQIPIYLDGTSYINGVRNSISLQSYGLVGSSDQIFLNDTSGYDPVNFSRIGSGSATGANGSNATSGSVVSTLAVTEGFVTGIHYASQIQADSMNLSNLAINGASGRSQVTWNFTITEPTSFHFDGSVSAEARGDSQGLPVLPVTQTMHFIASTGQWIDPPGASGFDFTMIGDSLFNEILSFPLGIDADGAFDVWVGPSDSFLGTFYEGESVDFVSLLGEGVTSFRITGINPLVDGGDPLAFPIQLAFDTPTAEFTMIPISATSNTTVPEPTSVALVVLGGVTLVGWRRR